MQACGALEPRLASILYPVPAPGHFAKEFVPLVISGRKSFARSPLRSHTIAASTSSKGEGGLQLKYCWDVVAQVIH